MQIEVHEHLSLSEFRPEDRAALLKHLNETDLFHRQLLTMPYPYTEADADEFFAKLASETLEKDRVLHFAIRDRSGSLIGSCGLKDIHLEHRAEIGYWLARPYWGQGIMPQVVQRMWTWSCEELKLVRLLAHLYASNTGSARVLEKCGFRQEGYLHKHYRKEGEFLDARIYAKVR